MKKWIKRAAAALGIAFAVWLTVGMIVEVVVLLMLNLHFLRQAYKVYQEAALVFFARQYSCLLINAVCNFSLRSASLFSVLALKTSFGVRYQIAL